MFQCPICEQNTSIPVGGASALPQNLHLGFEVEVAGYMSKMVNNSEMCCDECVDGRNGLAVVFCCMCHQFLCKAGARQLHTTMKPRDHYCSQPSHEDNKLNFYSNIGRKKKDTSVRVGGHFTVQDNSSDLQKEQFEKMVGDIGHYINMVSQILQTHTDHEIVALGGLVPTELQATLKRVQTISLTPNQHSNITVSVQTDDLVRQLSKLGEIIVFFPSPSSCTWVSTSVARVGTRYHVQVQSKTSKGEEYPHGGVEVKGEMRSKTHNGAVVYGEVEDHRDGQLKNTIGSRGSGDCQFSYPSGISIKGDLLYVADTDNHRVQKLTSSGKFLHKFGQQGSAFGSNTIKVFTKEGVYVRTYGDPNGPRGLAIDGEGYSLVSGNCLSIYDPEGNKIHTVGNLTYPYGTALDPRDGSVFIANYGANTVLKYCV
eukprot:Em0004g613a